LTALFLGSAGLIRLEKQEGGVNFYSLTIKTGVLIQEVEEECSRWDWDLNLM
jgi:hypothetical protein